MYTIAAGRRSQAARRGRRAAHLITQATGDSPARKATPSLAPFPPSIYRLGGQLVKQQFFKGVNNSMTFIRNRITLSIKYFQQSHGGLLPQKIAMNPETYANLKAEIEEDDEVWNDDYFGIPIEIDEKEIDYHLFGAVILKHCTCPLCGWTDKKENFSHRIDYVDICNHCFENIYSHKNVDVEWTKQVNEHNDIVRNEMDENYLKTYGEILFGEKE